MNKGHLKRQMFGYLQSIGFYEYRNGWMKGDCPSCGAEDKYGVNLEANRTHCFKCELVDSPLKMIMNTNSLPTYKHTYEFLKGFDSANYKPPVAEKYEEKPVILPQGFKLMKYGDSRISRIARNYMRRRGFTDMRWLSAHGVGYVHDRQQDFYGYIIFAYKVDRKVVYYQTRNFLDNGPRFKNPTLEEFGIGKRQVIYNIMALRNPEVDLTESVINALTMGDSGIAIQGKVLSPWQKSKILTSRVELVNILLDDDAWEYALGITSDLVPFKKVRVIQFPKEKDVNDLGKAEVEYMKKHSPIISNINEALKVRWNT